MTEPHPRSPADPHQPTPTLPTTVHHDEITLEQPRNPLLPQINYTQENAHQTFRHSFWRLRRIRTFETLTYLFPNSNRVNRFANCGSHAFVLRSREHPTEYRLRTNRCKDRFCEPCAREKRVLVGQNLARQLPRVPLRLLTLTIKSSSQPLDFQLRRICSCFSRLRQRKEWKTLVRGGVWFVELTLNPRTGLWHPHIHAIFEGRYLPLDLIRKLWHDVTKDSYIVDLKFISKTEWVASYVAKYAGKTIPHEVWSSPKHLAEAIKALEGKRTFSTFGTWKSLNLSEVPQDDDTWINIGPLAEVIQRAIHGDPEARYALTQLSIKPIDPQDTS